MNRHRQSTTWLEAVLGTVCALLILTLGAHGSDHRGALTEEFHQTYPLAADGRVELDNINGSVHITSWDRNEVKVDAIKSADTKERLDEAKIEIDSRSSALSIRTHYPDHDHTWNWGSHNNPANVEYTLTVPRNARLDEIKLINGSLDLAGVSGEVNASCINGRLVAQFDRLARQSMELNSVNGSVDLTIPSDSNAEVEASTVSGGIDNDFGLHVNHHSFVGHDMRGELGTGGAHIKLSNVNGHVEVHHAQDGHALSPAKDLSHRDKDDDDSI